MVGATTRKGSMMGVAWIAGPREAVDESNLVEGIIVRERPGTEERQLGEVRVYANDDGDVAATFVRFDPPRPDPEPEPDEEAVA